MVGAPLDTAWRYGGPRTLTRAPAAHMRLRAFTGPASGPTVCRRVRSRGHNASGRESTLALTADGNSPACKGTSDASHRRHQAKSRLARDFRSRPLLPRSQGSRLSELAVNPLMNPVGGHAHETRFRFTHRDGVADLETPFPEARLDQQQGKFNALAVHDFRENNATLASSSASSFSRILCSASVWGSARRFL